MYAEFLRIRYTKFIFVIWSLSAVTISDGATTTICPTECTCRSTLDPEGTSVLSVECTRGDMRSIPIEHLDHRADIIIITAPENRPNYLTIGPIFTQPSNIRRFENLRELHIVNSNVPSIGQYSFWGLKNLRLVNLTHNNLTSIGADNFRGLINLTELYLDNNKIEQMPSDTFRHLTALKILKLTHNNISNLVDRLFRMLANLWVLDLSYNPLEDLNPEVFKDIQHLRIFRCRQCLLRRINTQIYHLVPHLFELDLGENQFKYLTSDEYISLKKLKTLYLDGNQLSVVVDNMFAKNHELQFLSLARNRLALLAPAALTNLTTLVHLDISHNKIDRFHLQTFAPVVDSLKTVNFSGNNLPLNEIAIVLHILPEIQEVGLANLSIKELPVNFFIYNEHLTALDISWNKITMFPYKLLTKTKFLQRLDISRNRLYTLGEDDLIRLEAIAHVDLAKNHWRCDQCSAATMLVFMTTTVLNSTIRRLRCHSPLKVNGVSFGDLTFDGLEQCGASHEAQMSVIAGLMLLGVAVLAAVTTALCCSRRRAMHYYTNEEKRKEHNHDHPEELLGHTDSSSVATINAPYQVGAKDS